MRLSICILVLFFSNLSFAQIRDGNCIYIDVSCAAGAQTSLEIKKFKLFNDVKDYRSIRERLFSDNPLDQVLSVILLSHYSKRGEILLTYIEKRKIKKISKSKYRFHLCFTCLTSEDGTLKQLFSGRRKFTYELVKGTMLSTFTRS
jgi:hypothetical protein